MVEASFAELVGRLQDDDREAVELLVTRYGRALRRAIDRALFEHRLVGGSDHPADREASDLFQTVLLLFLARLQRVRSGEGSGGALTFETPGHLVAYLKAIAEHEIGRRRPRGGTAFRLGSRHSLVEVGGQGRAGIRVAESADPTPSRSLIARELLERDPAALAEIEGKLRPDERAIWELVRPELSWPEIARRLGGSADALRKTFSRAVKRIAEELGSRGLDHDSIAQGRNHSR
jgi:DNA-directed RNA polymerase specialized sigma24 family protein